MDESHWSGLLRPLFAGRRVIVKHEIVAGSVSLVHAARSLGATDVFVLATNGPGTGPLPEPDEARWCSLGVSSAGGMLVGIRAGNAAIASLPQWAKDELDRFDPDRTALVVSDFLNESPELDGRPFLAYRRPEWLALDDKTVVDELWDRCGVERSPSTVVPATVAAVGGVWDDFDRGDGVVLAIDAQEGWTGGTHGVRRVRRAGDLGSALKGWDGGDRFVRVMPFLEGIPCSIHGIVFPGTVIALRPVEMIVLRTADGGFFYAGCSSFWDPPEADRASMRSTALAVGERLREEVDYRGAFTIDGVMTAAGFRPTELNPRNGAGLSMMARDVAIPIPLVLDALVAGIDGDWRPNELERTLLAEFDSRRTGGTWRLIDTQAVVEEVEFGLVRDGDGVRAAEPEEPADVSCTFGPSAGASFFRALFAPGRIPAGPSAAPLAAHVWAHMDSAYGLDIGPLTAASEVRA